MSNLSKAAGMLGISVNEMRRPKPKGKKRPNKVQDQEDSSLYNTLSQESVSAEKQFEVLRELLGNPDRGELLERVIKEGFITQEEVDAFRGVTAEPISAQPSDGNDDG